MYIKKFWDDETKINIRHTENNFNFFPLFYYFTSSSFVFISVKDFTTKTIDTSSVAMNPTIKFTTLFGLLALELAIVLNNEGHLSILLAALFFIVYIVFVVKSFTDMKTKD